MTGLPTLSSIQAWGVEHLTDAADQWTATADRWENTFVQVWQQSHGLPWEGYGADALHERTSADKTMAVRKADQLREAVTIVRRGASDISAAQRRVMYAVEDAHNAGFTVGEDLSVTDTRSSRDAAERAIRQSQAQVFAADIRQRAAQLVGLDQEVGGNITAAAGDVGNTTFTEKPITYDGKEAKIRLVGNGDASPTPPPHIPTTEERERGLAGRVIEGAIIGGILGTPEGGVGALPGALVGGGVGGIEWFIEETQK